MAHILIVDAQMTSRTITEDVLSEYDLASVPDAGAAINSASENAPDLIVLDVSLGSHSGMELLYELRTYTDWVDIPVIMYTSIRLSDKVVNSRAWKKLGIVDYLYKPEVSVEDLRRAVSKHLVTVGS